MQVLLTCADLLSSETYVNDFKVLEFRGANHKNDEGISFSVGQCKWNVSISFVGTRHLSLSIDQICQYTSIISSLFSLFKLNTFITFYFAYTRTILTQLGCLLRKETSLGPQNYQCFIYEFVTRHRKLKPFSMEWASSQTPSNEQGISPDFGHHCFVVLFGLNNTSKLDSVKVRVLLNFLLPRDALLRSAF